MGNCASTSDQTHSPIKVDMQKILLPKKHQFKDIKQTSVPHGTSSNGKITDLIIKNKQINYEAYKSVFEKVSKEGQPFQDSEFPRSLVSIGNENLGKDIKWQRPSKFIGNEFALFQGKIDPTDIHQGKLGDCYLMSAIALISQHPYIVQRIFQVLEINQYGIYGVWLCIDGIWKIIVLDDYFPIEQNNLIFSKNKGKQIWVMLIQKAYAKAYGSYHKIQSGLTGAALFSLTGAPYQYFNKDSKLKSKQKQSQLWQFIRTNFQKNYFLAGSSQKNDRNQNFNIVSGHSYAILDIRQVKVLTKNGQKSEKILKLMNPWGRFQWKGKWSDQSPVWTQQLKSQLNYVDKDDGIFWMNVHDFSQTFGQVCASKYNKDYFSTFLNLNFPNSQIGFKGVYMTVNIRAKGFISLNQKDHRRFQNYKYAVVRMIILQINTKTHNFQRYVSDFIDCDRDCSMQIVFQPGLYYIAIQADWYSQLSRSLVLNFYGQQGVHFSEDQQLPTTMDSLLNQMIILHQNTTQKQRIHQYASDPKIKRITGSVAGYVYYHYTNNSQSDKYLVQTVTLKQRKFIKVYNQEKYDEFSIKISPGQQKIVKLRVQNYGNGFYSYSTKIQFYIVEGFTLQKLRDLCDKKPTKVKKRQIQGKPIDVFVKTYSYSGGVAVLYQNKMDKYAFIEQMELQLQNLQLQNGTLNGKNQLQIELEPHTQKLLSFLVKKPGQSVSFKTTMSFYLNSPEFKF